METEQQPQKKKKKKKEGVNFPGEGIANLRGGSPSNFRWL